MQYPSLDDLFKLAPSGYPIIDEWVRENFRVGRESEPLTLIEVLNLGYDVVYEDLEDEECEVIAQWFDLAQHRVSGYRNGLEISAGSGSNVLGDPRIALTWIANELIQFGDGLSAGDVVTTGTCIPPIAVNPGDHVRMDFGIFGSIEARFS
jgi:hypothetical protein